MIYIHSGAGVWAWRTLGARRPTIIIVVLLLLCVLLLLLLFVLLITIINVINTIIITISITTLINTDLLAGKSQTAGINSATSISVQLLRQQKIYAYVCIYIYIYIHTCIYIYIYTHNT